MARRLVAVMAAMALLGLGVASGTRLGVFDPPLAAAMTRDLAPCTVSEVRLLDDTLGGLVDLVTAPLSALDALSEIDVVRLEGVTGDCHKATPTVLVGGLDLVSGGGEQVLFVEDLDPLADGANGTIDITLASPVSVSALLYDLTFAQAGFCPEGAACP